MTEILKAVLFGILEGITEWLPISSTGHMILLNEFVKLDVSPEFWNLFLVVIQLGAILAVVFLYKKTIWPLRMIKRKDGKRRVAVKRQTMLLWAKVIIACIPAGVVGVLFDDWLDEHLQNWQCVSLMLVLVGIAFLIVEKVNEGKEPVKTRLSDLTFRDAFVIGLFQLIADHDVQRVGHLVRLGPDQSRLDPVDGPVEVVRVVSGHIFGEEVLHPGEDHPGKGR